MFAIFGKGSWLVDVQAHTINEGGQFLLLNVDKSYIEFATDNTFTTSLCL